MNTELYENLVQCAYEYLTKHDEKRLKSDLNSAIKDAQNMMNEDDDEEESEDE